MRYSSSTVPSPPVPTGPPPLSLSAAALVASWAPPQPDTSGDEEMARALIEADSVALAQTNLNKATDRETDYLVGLMEDLDGDRIAASDNEGDVDSDDLFGRDCDVFDVVVGEDDERAELEIFGHVALMPPPQRKKKRLIEIEPEEEEEETHVSTDGPVEPFRAESVPAAVV